MSKSHEEKEIEDFAREQAIKTVRNQQLAQAGAEMRNWVDAGHFDFIQKRVLMPIELECFKTVKTVRLGPAAVTKIAEIKGTLHVFDIIAARIESIIALGDSAIAELKALQDSTQSEGG